MVQTADGGYAFVGDGNASIFFVKTNSSGSTGLCNEANVSSLTTNPVLAQNTPNITTYVGIQQQRTRMGVFHFTSYGDVCTLGNEEQIDNTPTVKVFPNPFSNTTELWITNSNLQNAVFELFDVLGKPVLQMEITPGPSTLINGHSLPAGIYHYRVSGHKEIIGTGKLIVE